MKKTVKRLLIATLSLLFTGLVFTACNDELDSSAPGLESSPFLENYQAEYGEVYYFETSVLNGRPLEYSVTQNGNSIEVSNNGFMISSLDPYTVNVKYVGEKVFLDTFEIQAIDNGAPHIAFSYQEKIVTAGSSVVLPTVSVSDNKDKDVQYTVKLAFLWHQGEHDAFEGNPAENYYKQLTDMLKGVRSRYGTMPFIAGDFVNDWKSKNLASCEPIVSVIRRVVAENTRSGFVETSDLLSNNQKTQNGDELHFCRESLYELGHRYYKVFSGL